MRRGGKYFYRTESVKSVIIIVIIEIIMSSRTQLIIENAKKINKGENKAQNNAKVNLKICEVSSKVSEIQKEQNMKEQSHFLELNGKFLFLILI